MSDFHADADDRVTPKLCGADVELGNLIVGDSSDRAANTAGDAARALLDEIAGFSRASDGSYYAPSYADSAWPPQAGGFYCDSITQDRDGGRVGRESGYQQYAQDRGRKFLPANGSSVYIDLDHLEICLPEVISAFDHVAAFGAMLRIAREAMVRANERMPAGRTIKVLVNNSNGHGNSYGSHLNFLTTRRCWNNVFNRRIQYLLFLASYQCAGIVLTGAGKVGSEIPGEPARYQIAARADFFEVLAGPQTTFHRPICNSRDEPLAGASGVGRGDERLARLHSIFFDNTLCQTSSLLKVGMTQIVLSMIEQEQVPAQFLLDDPVESLHRWSRDPEMKVKNRLIDGSEYTAVELLEAIFEKAAGFVDAGRASGLVSDVGRIMEIWGECLRKLRQRDFDYLAGRIDWVAKLSLLERTAAKRRLSWESPAMKYLDHLYSSLDPGEGLYWAMERAGAVRKIVSDGQIERIMHEPPDDTRAWLRAHILRHAGSGLLDDVDWDMVRIREKSVSPAGWTSYHYPALWMANPLRFTRRECEQILQAAPSFIEGLRALGLGREIGSGSTAGSTGAAIVQREQTTPAVPGKLFTGD
ncbi:MAG: proteasome accessory factor PafA2 family protein [Tepidisphaeraceae bacterium]|jgi:proteasome accessory factor A